MPVVDKCLTAEVGMKRIQAYTLYFCHALSTWNARSYEFAVVLFTAAAYPEGLRAASLIGISTSIAAICFGSAIGRWIDRSESRLRTLLTTIVINRIAIVSACLFWFLIVADTEPGSNVRDAEQGASKVDPSILQGAAKTVAFSVLLGLGIIESLSRKANLISIERDWVPVLASTGIERYNLTEINATMARIDMICKMISPISISWFLSAIPSVKLAIGIVALFNIVFLGFECLSTNSLWSTFSGLRKRRQSISPEEDNTFLKTRSSKATFSGAMNEVASWGSAYVDSLRLYFGSEVAAPSLSMCITHTSILSVTSVTVVFLLDSGYSLELVTIAQTISALFELSSTIIMPIAVKSLARTSKKRSHAHQSLPQDEPGDEDELEEVDGPEVENRESEGQESGSPEKGNLNYDVVDTAITRLGVWGIVGMVLILSPTVPILLFLTSHLPYPMAHESSSATWHNYPFLTILLLFCLSASRLGRGVFVLVTQQLAQSHVAEDQRSSFAGTEQAFISTFGLGHNLGTAIWSDPSDFGWLALGSFIGLACSSGLYVSWIRKRI